MRPARWGRARGPLGCPADGAVTAGNRVPFPGRPFEWYSGSAAPLVAVLLAVCVRAGLVQWDTGESVQRAASRLALDAAWRLLSDPNPVTAARVFADVADAMDLVDRPAGDYARTYLDERADIDAALAERDIHWGGRTLTAVQAADRAKVVTSTWTSYVARGQAPAADVDGQWRTATVDAWRITRTTVHHTGWWTAHS